MATRIEHKTYPVGFRVPVAFQKITCYWCSGRDDATNMQFYTRPSQVLSHEAAQRSQYEHRVNDARGTYSRQDVAVLCPECIQGEAPSRLKAEGWSAHDGNETLP